MAIHFDYSIENNTLKVIPYGKDESLEDAMNYGFQILKLSIENQCTKVFCDERNLEYSISVLDTYQLAETASKEARNLIKIAIVCDEKYLEDGNFYETVARNRGLNVLATPDYNQAKDWLEE